MVDAGELVAALERAQEQKKIGNAAFKEKDNATALARYLDAVDLLKMIHKPMPASSEEMTMLWTECTSQGMNLELACRLNAALCHLKLEQWTEAADAAGYVVRMDGTCAKAYFRRALARAGGGQDELAVFDFRKAAKLAPKDRSIRTELAAAKARLAAITEETPQAAAEDLSRAFADGSLYADAPAPPTTTTTTTTTTTDADGNTVPFDDGPREERADRVLAAAMQLKEEGKFQEAVNECDGVFRLLRVGFAPAELVLQRFRARVFSAQCLRLHAASPAASPSARKEALETARQALKTAISYLDMNGIEDSGVIPRSEMDTARELLIFSPSVTQT